MKAYLRRARPSLAGVSRVALVLAVVTAALGGAVTGCEEGDRSSLEGDGKPSEAPCAAVANGFAATPLRRLSREEYRNTLTDLFGVGAPAAADLPEDGELGGFRTTADQLLSPAQIDKYLDGASAVADRFLAEKKLACEAQNETPCVEQFLDGTGTRIFRRPLSPEERGHYAGVFTTSRSAAPFEEAAATMLSAMLLAPQFLFFVEPRPTGVAEGQAYPVDDWQLATRLSYVFWHTTPDAELLGLARAGKLHEAETLQAQGQRLIADERARPVARDFLAQWLKVDKIADVVVDDTIKNPDLTPALLADLAVETDQFTQAAFWGPGDTLKALLVSPTRFRNKNLSAFYQDPLGTTDAVRETAGQVSERSFGLFSQAGFMAAISRSPDNAIIYRGRFLRERFLCTNLSPPPPGTVTPLPRVTPGTPNRQRVADHTAGKVCTGCHQLMNPLGYTLEHFDRFGRWREEDQGLPIDARAEILKSDFGSVDGALGLATKLSESAEVRACAAKQIFQYTLSRRPAPSDACAFDMLNGQSSRSFRDLFLAVAQNPAFLLRVEPTVKGP